MIPSAKSFLPKSPRHRVGRASFQLKESLVSPNSNRKPFTEGERTVAQVGHR